MPPTLRSHKKMAVLPLLKNFKESKYNMYASQQICGFRDTNVEEEVNADNNNDATLQSIYDMGCALIDMGIVIKNSDGEYALNKDFGDYDGWVFAEENVLKNCIFLERLGHSKFTQE